MRWGYNIHQYFTPNLLPGIMRTQDLRSYARQTNLRLGIGFIALLLIVGIGLIYVIFGLSAALMGLICISAGLFPILLIGLSLWLMDEFIKRNRED